MSYNYINLPIKNNCKQKTEHAAVVEYFLGRPIAYGGRVHHVNEVKTCNHPMNLILFRDESAHKRFHNNPKNVKDFEIVWDGRKLKEPIKWV